MWLRDLWNETETDRETDVTEHLDRVTTRGPDQLSDPRSCA